MRSGAHLRPEESNFTSAEPSVFCDAQSERLAAALARSVALRVQRLDDIPPAALARVSSAFVVMDLLDAGSVAAFRRGVGRAPPAERRWAFVVPTGLPRHAAEVQANALGATVHITITTAARDLRRLLSISSQVTMSASARAQLQKAAGGESILAAGDALGDLFGQITNGGKLATHDLSDIGANVVEGIRSVGAEAWLNSVRDYHEGTFQHCLLVTGAAAAFVSRHRLQGHAAERLTTAALLHDIGKSVVPLHILDKPGRLTDAEFAIVKSHPGAGHKYLAGQRGVDAQVLDAVLHHHEALDGSGYPDGLKDAEIAMLTRVLTVCDIYAALVEARAYKPARPPEEAVSVLVQLALNGKVDYGVVSSLAQAFGMNPPRTIDEVRANLAAGVPFKGAA
jgi:putative nucleotidyltransferase with HDIG domain